MTITYAAEATLSVNEFKHILIASGLAERRPADDEVRLQKMLAGADLTIVARNAEGIAVGVARCVTDFAYCLYCSDLAVDTAYQGRGIGKRLLAETVSAAPGVKTFLLLSAPKAVSFYEAAGYTRTPNAFIYHQNT